VAPSPYDLISKACGHLSQGNFDGGQIDHCSVALISLFVAGGDASECFEIAEEVFDEVPPAVGMKIAVDLAFAVRFGRDHGDGAPVVQFRSEPVSIEGLIAQEHIEFHALDQRFDPNQIMGLPGQKNKADKIPQRIN